MCDPVSITMAVVGVASAYSSYQQGKAAMSSAQAQADMLNKQGEETVKRADQQAGLVQDTAKFEGRNQAVKAAELSSAQKAALAANGVDLSSGTAEDITLDSMSKAQQDENIIRYNADSKAWSIQEDAKYKNWALRSEADSALFQGKQARHQANIQAGVSLVGAAVSAGGGIMGAMGKTGGISSGGGMTTTTQRGGTTFLSSTVA